MGSKGFSLHEYINKTWLLHSWCLNIVDYLPPQKLHLLLDLVEITWCTAVVLELYGLDLVLTNRSMTVTMRIGSAYGWQFAILWTSPSSHGDPFRAQHKLPNFFVKVYIGKQDWYKSYSCHPSHLNVIDYVVRPEVLLSRNRCHALSLR